ncbi:MAG: alcohol dehydrogenase catalytic domain-containing protein [Planctomycetota bacterium]|nr:alcohol dehydrogenase catalytic domain-containing protein [Planctomycetota bacterium]
MFALYFDGSVHLRTNHPVPVPESGEALIQVSRAGICNTDIEITKGYMGFRGVLGHEFVGHVEHSEDRSLIGKRVAGEINFSCGRCQTCRAQMRNHCPHRTVMGILNKDGAFAEYVTIPIENLHLIPESLDDVAAVFIEPLAAACRIKEQLRFVSEERVAIIGDGKLGLLIAEVLGRHLPNVRLFGKHDEKMQLVSSVVETLSINTSPSRAFDVVVDASGHPDGLKDAMRMVRPMGTIILKSTCASDADFRPSPIVIDELTLVGSRCGPFDKAIEFMQSHDLRLGKYITATYPLAEAEEALRKAREGGVLKVQLVCE